MVKKRVTEGLYNILILFLLYKVHLLSLRVSTTLRKGPLKHFPKREQKKIRVILNPTASLRLKDP